MRYAQIEKEKIVNIIEASKQGAESLSSYMTLVETDKPVAIGDTYTDGKFYRSGEEVLTDREEFYLFYSEMENVIME